MAGMDIIDARPSPWPRPRRRPAGPPRLPKSGGRRWIFIIDTFAVMAAGAAHPSLHRSPSVSRMRWARTVVGYPTARALSEHAALLNGATTTVLQLQDGHRIARGHPMSHVLPAAFAVAEEHDATPEEFLSSVVAGYEVSARVGRALGGLQDLLHDTGTFGTIGAAVATAFLVSGADETSLRRPSKGRRPSPSSPIAPHPWRVRPCIIFMSVWALRPESLPARPLSSACRPCRHAREASSGPVRGRISRLRRLTEGIGSDGRWESYECLQAYLKLHPTCAHLNGINDAALELLQRGSVEVTQIERIDVESYGTALDYNIAEPSNDLSARFSIPFAVAIAFHTGPLGPESITDIALANPAIRDLAKRVHVRHEPELDRGYPAGRPARSCRDDDRRAHSPGGSQHPPR